MPSSDESKKENEENSSNIEHSIVKRMAEFYKNNIDNKLSEQSSLDESKKRTEEKGK